MKKLYRMMLLSLMTAAAALVFSSCNQLDVIGSGSAESFGKVLEAMEDGVSRDEAHSGWSLASPDGSSAFVWSGASSPSGGYSALLTTDAQPFLDAGLDGSKLPEGMLSDGRITVGLKLASADGNGKESSLDAFKEVVRAGRDSIQYHSELDHFGVSLGGGHVFEWAKDMSKNDKDIVFVLDPQVFADAGTDVENIEGWTYAAVKIMDEEVYKLLKPFDIE